MKIIFKINECEQLVGTIDRIAEIVNDKFDMDIPLITNGDISTTVDALLEIGGTIPAINISQVNDEIIIEYDPEFIVDVTSYMEAVSTRVLDLAVTYRIPIIMAIGGAKMIINDVIPRFKVLLKPFESAFKILSDELGKGGEWVINKWLVSKQKSEEPQTENEKVSV